MAPSRTSLSGLVLRYGTQYFGEVIRILRLLWLEVTGAIFLALAAFGIPSAIREWRLLEEGGSLVRFVTTILFIGMMAGFGIFSFWKARRFR
jgi:hypothetical protein